MRPLQVALFTESYHPVLNGVTTSVDSLASELSAQGHFPTIIAPRFTGYTDLTESAPVLRIPSWRTPFNPQNPFAYPPVFTPSALRDMRCDIVHTHHPFGIGMHAQAVARRWGVPLVATFHTLYQEYGHYVSFLPGGIVRGAVSWWLRRFYNDCDAVLAPSEFAAGVLRDIGVKTPIHVIPTGVPDAPPHSAETPPVSPILLYVGRMAKEKNLDLLLDMLACVHDATLWMVGGGPYAETLKRRAGALSIADRVRWFGFVPHADLPPIYRAATLFVFPSQSETQGIVLSEAQSFGLPVVNVRGGGAAESVRDGIDALVVPCDTSAFADAVRALLEPARHERFSEAARTSPKRLTPAASARRVWEIYESVLKTTGRKRNLRKI